MAAPSFTLVRATPHQLVYFFDGDTGGAQNFVTLGYAVLLSDAINGPLKSALVASSALITTADEARACLLGGSFPLPTLSSGFSDIQTSGTQSTLVGKSFLLIDATTSGIDANPDLLIAVSGTGYLYVTHRWSPTV